MDKYQKIDAAILARMKGGKSELLAYAWVLGYVQGFLTEEQADEMLAKATSTLSTKGA